MNKIEVGSSILVLEQVEENGITIEVPVEYLILAGDSYIICDPSDDESVCKLALAETETSPRKLVVLRFGTDKFGNMYAGHYKGADREEILAKFIDSL